MSRPGYFARVFTPRNGIIFVIAAALFIGLNIYRLNDALPVGSQGADLALENYKGEKFKLSDIASAKVLLFYKKHAYFSNYVINKTYERELRAFNLIYEKALAPVIVIAEGYDTKEELAELLSDSTYAPYTNIIFATDTKFAGKEYGVRSWPHLFVLDSLNRVIYETKIGTAEKARDIIWRR